MVRRFALIWIMVIVCLAGCSGSGTTGNQASRNDSAGGMIEYLQQANLPALKSVESWQNDYGTGLKLSTAHYEIFTTLLDPLMLSQIPGFMESAYCGYNSLLPRPIETTTRFTVYLLRDRQQWEDFTKTFAGSAAPLFCRIEAGAYYLKGACVTYNIGRERTFSALGHEGWHQFNSRCFKFRLPSWLDEGIAMLFEASRSYRGLFYFEPGQNTYRLAGLSRTLTEGKMIPLKELLAISPGEVVGSSDEAATAFYGQSYALVRFLREADYAKRLGNFHRLLLDGLRGDWPLGKVSRRIAADRNIPLTVRWNRAVGTQLFKEYIGDDFEGIQREYFAFCRKIVCQTKRLRRDTGTEQCPSSIRFRSF